MTARLLVLGFDAMEARLVEDGIARGDLPAFAALRAASAAHHATNPMSSLPGAIWPEINTGRSAEPLGLYFHPSQLHTGEPVPRQVRADEIDPAQDWWQIAGDAGRRVLVLDVPHAVPRPGTNGLHVTDWGNHDRSWPAASDPPDALAAVHAIVGPHPIGRCDTVVRDGRLESYRVLLDRLVESVELRTRLTETLMAREPWDAVHVAFAESHCVGHQFWAFADPRHPVALPDRPAVLAGAISTVYAAIDRGVARLVEAAGPEAAILTVMSHGMGPYVGGYQLLPAVLTRLGLRPPPSSLAAAPARLPAPIRAGLRRAVPDRLRWRRIARAGTLAHHDLASPRTRAAVLLNNRCGAIRLNLRGREPHGTVEPGAEAEALLTMLETELTALTDPRTGERIVAEVHRPAAEAPGTPHPDLPDLTVAFRTDLGAIEACTSPRVGRIDAPLWSRDRRPDGWPRRLGRTGDHTAESRIWIRAAGVAPTTESGSRVSVRDLAPTALTLLGVPVPPQIEGRSLV